MDIFPQSSTHTVETPRQTKNGQCQITQNCDVSSCCQTFSALLFISVRLHFIAPSQLLAAMDELSADLAEHHVEAVLVLHVHLQLVCWEEEAQGCSE